MLGDIWPTREAKFNHKPLLNMLVAINAGAPACYAISGIPALPTSTSGFFLVAGLKTLRCSLNLKSQMTPYSTSALCISSGKGCTSHRPLSSQPLVFLCCSFEYCCVNITTEHKYVSGGTHAAFLSLSFLFFLPTHTLTEALSCDISLVSSGQTSSITTLGPNNSTC